MANTKKLRKWFSDKSIQIYFGARSQAEIDEAVTFFESLSPADMDKFKGALAGVAGDAIRGK